MSQFIRKNKRHLSGVAVPFFLLFLVAAIGLSIFPGWLRPSYSGLNACTTVIVSTTPLTPQDEARLLLCNPCNGEFCSNGTCASTTAVTCPGGGDPDCYDQCQNTIQDNGGTFFPVQDCAPNDAFCDGFSGGTSANECRLAICIPGLSTVDPGNPSGCDYSAVVDPAACVNCAPPTPVSENCGNGVCEQEIGETFASCSVDCRAPGFTGAAPLPSGDGTLNAACDNAGFNLSFIEFSGNVPGGGTCEDGDVCTTNRCNVQTLDCDVAPAQCSGDVVDFCCPSGCTVAPDGPGSCPDLAATPCDVDCLPPQDCEPTPPPTPSPLPPPLTGLCLSGSSLISGDGNPAPACDCSLNPNATYDSGRNAAMGLMSLALAAGLLVWRKRAR